MNKENISQISLMDKITNYALKKLEKENKKKPRNYINEWFRYVEIVNEELKKHLN
jgi:hypothetical protein